MHAQPTSFQHHAQSRYASRNGVPVGYAPIMTDRGTIQRSWLREMMRRYGLSYSDLERRTGKHRSTFSRFLKDETGELNESTVAAVADAVGEPRPRYAEDQGFSESGLTAIDQDHPLAALAPPPLPHETDFLVTTEEMAHADIRPGDVLRVDLNAKPKPGSLVIAQLYHGDDATTVCRFYDMPWLYSASTDPLLRRPIMINDVNVRIAGVVKRQYRQRDWDVSE